MNSLRLLLIAAIVLPVGCSDPKAANENNFAKAISAYLQLEEGRGRFCIGHGKYPFHEDLPGQWTEADLAHVGLLEVTGRAENFRGYTTDVFDLTSKGREVFIPGKGFRYGKPELIRIVNFTEPGSIGPYVMSRVTYLYRLREVPSWATESNGQIVEAFRERIPMLSGQSQEDTQTFVLTGNGWVHESLFAK